MQLVALSLVVLSILLFSFFLSCSLFMLTMYRHFYSMDLSQARRDPRDAALCTVVEAHDLPLQSAVAAQAAGPNPIAPRDAALLPTPGMDWLERMKATDEALQKSIGKHDAVLSNPSG